MMNLTNNLNSQSNLENNSKKSPNKKSWFKKSFSKIAMFGLSSVLVIGSVTAATISIVNNIERNTTSGEDGGNSDDVSQISKGLDYNTSSSANYWISQRTISLLFSYVLKTNSGQIENASTAGTGWIYQANQNSNTFYIATNLHVANILSFKGNSVTSYSENSDRYTTSTYESNNFSSYVGIALGLSESVNSYSNNIAYFPVDTPEVVYTTTSDSNFNNLFNTSTSLTSSTSTSSSDSSSTTYQKNYYGVGSNGKTQFYGAADIAVLKYTINTSSYSTSSNIITNHSSSLSNSSKSSYIDTFSTWIKNYFNNPTKIYTDYVDNLSNLDTTKLYMAGYPSYDSTTGSTGSSLSDITWIGFSDFTVSTSIKENNKTIATFDALNYDGNTYSNSSISNDSLQTPIAFYSSNTLSSSSSDSSSTSTSSGFWLPSSSTDSSYTNYNYISIGVSSYLEASSFSGSSGSPVVIQDSDGNFKIAGIYWGGLTMRSTSGQTYNRGIMTWFSTNSYKLGSNTISYNLTNYISQAIQSSSSKNQ